MAAGGGGFTANRKSADLKVNATDLPRPCHCTWVLPLVELPLETEFAFLDCCFMLFVARHEHGVSAVREEADGKRSHIRGSYLRPDGLLITSREVL